MDGPVELEGLLSVAISLGLNFGPVLRSRQRRVAPEAIERVRRRTVEASILEEWVTQWDVVDPRMRDHLRAIVAHGVRGGKAGTITAAFEGCSVSEKTLRRRLAAADLPNLGALLRDARLASVRARTELGMSLRDAVRAAGFNSEKVYDSMVSRHKRRG